MVSTLAQIDVEFVELFYVFFMCILYLRATLVVWKGGQKRGWRGVFCNQREYEYHSICFIEIWCFFPSSQGMMLDFDDFENAADNA